jgi:hypothetical protein
VPVGWGAMMQKSKLPLWILVGLLWIILLPMGIVLLYSAIELQTAARSAPKTDPRLATLHTIALTHKLDAAEAAGDQAARLHQIIRLKRNEWLNSRSDVRFAAVDILTAHGIKGASAACTAPQEVLTKCVSQYDGGACLADWTVVQKCYDDAVPFESASDADRRAVQAMRDGMKAARKLGYEYNALVARWTEANDLEQNPLFPVAEALRQPLLKTPLQAFFVMPHGVVIACFTSLMAVLGAGAASLITFQRSRAAAKTDALKSFLIAPLIGGLTGFMVYFVVSAGTAVLIQPSPADPSQPVSNLSAPALASLGVLAGLAAEQAIAWLRDKASAFFRNQEPPEARSQPRSPEPMGET